MEKHTRNRFCIQWSILDTDRHRWWVDLQLSLLPAQIPTLSFPNTTRSERLGECCSPGHITLTHTTAMLHRTWATRTCTTKTDRTCSEAMIMCTSSDDSKTWTSRCRTTWLWDVRTLWFLDVTALKMWAQPEKLKKHVRLLRVHTDVETLLAHAVDCRLCTSSEVRTHSLSGDQVFWDVWWAHTMWLWDDIDDNISSDYFLRKSSCLVDWNTISLVFCPI
jgi:hypothetical protein